MNYAKLELLDELAAQYVLGTLRGGARQRFEQLLNTSATARDVLSHWELLLQPISLLAAPIPPPEAARSALLDEAFALRQPTADTYLQPAVSSTVGTNRRAQQRPRDHRASSWSQHLRFLIAASICGVTIVLGAIQLSGGRLSFPASHGQSSDVAGAVAEAQQPMPVALARLAIPTSSMRWLISLSTDRKTLSITASDDYYAIGRSSVQLWWLANDQAPKPLAILGTERDSTVTVDVPPGLESGQTMLFAISIEPSGGSPTGKPTGPVLDQVQPAQGI